MFGAFSVRGVDSSLFERQGSLREPGGFLSGDQASQPVFDYRGYEDAQRMARGFVEGMVSSIAAQASPTWGTSVTSQLSGDAQTGWDGDFMLDEPRRAGQERETLTPAGEEASSRGPVLVSLAENIALRASGQRGYNTRRAGSRTGLR